MSVPITRLKLIEAAFQSKIWNNIGWLSFLYLSNGLICLEIYGPEAKSPAQINAIESIINLKIGTKVQNVINKALGLITCIISKNNIFICWLIIIRYYCYLL